MKRCFLVLGPESSGTRWLTSILCDAGCAGSAEHQQPWDSEPLRGDLVVWRRSFPHGAEWPNLTAMFDGLRDNHYDVFGLVMVRDWFAMESSQRRFRDDDVTTNTQRAYRDIFLALQDVPFIVVSYEALLSRPDAYATRLLERLELSQPVTVAAIDGNEKYYGEILCHNYGLARLLSR